MLLQEIFQPEYASINEIYALDINAESSETKYSRPPKNFNFIGFNLVLDSDNLIADELLDIMISYSLTNISVILEIPSQLLVDKTLKIPDLLQFAQNGNFLLSFLPPQHPLVNGSITNEQYLEVIKETHQLMITRDSFEQFIAPISNFLEYLMLEKLLGKNHPAIDNFTPDNEYVQSNFVQYMTVQESNDFKDVLRNDLYQFYGGEESFNLVAQTIFESIYNKSQAVFTGHIQSYMLKEKEQYEKEHGIVSSTVNVNNDSSDNNDTII